jgi:ferredoxin
MFGTIIRMTRLSTSTRHTGGDALPTDAPEAKRLLVCDCAGTMKIATDALARAAGAAKATACTALCRAEAARAQTAFESGDDVVIACGQEAAFFEDLADEFGAADRLLTVDIRDRAGWTDDKDATPKQAALIAEALLARPATPAKTLVSEGVCLVYGAGEVALAAAVRLSDALAVTCMLSDAGEISAPPEGNFTLVRGRIAAAKGALGGFVLQIDRFAQLAPAGRGALGFEAPRDGASSACDVILDLSGGAALFPAPAKRDGYVRADPGDPLAVERAVFDTAQLVGEFEKPLHIRFDAAICAHSRASQQGCDRCLNVCPTGAILPDGDSVAIDADICAGCGACAAVCPSGAAAYDDPPVAHLFLRLRTLAGAYREAGGAAPRLLVHDETFGAEMIALAARHGRGLPADAIPLAVENVEGFGHAEALAAFGVGFTEVVVLASPRTDHAALDPQVALAGALLSGAGWEAGRLRVIEPADPDALSDLLYGERPAAREFTPILPVGGRRDVTRLSVKALAGGTVDAIPLPEGAPYGATLVDTEACTLCLSCVSLCPSGALLDNEDKPQLRFQEDACLQCGICVSACPEDAITLAPQLNLSDAALSGQVLHEEEPFACIDCGALFGVKSTIERITEKLADKHWMFTNSDNAKLIQMCDNCRVNAQFRATDNPFAMGERPRVRTTQDWIDDDKKDDA